MWWLFVDVDDIYDVLCKKCLNILGYNVYIACCQGNYTSIVLCRKVHVLQACSYIDNISKILT